MPKTKIHPVKYRKAVISAKPKLFNRVKKKTAGKKKIFKTKVKSKRVVLRRKKNLQTEQDNLFNSKAGKTDALFVDNIAGSGRVKATKDLDNSQQISLNNMTEYLQVPIKVPVPPARKATEGQGQKVLPARKIFPACAGRSFSTTLLSILVGLIFAGVFCAGVYVLALRGHTRRRLRLNRDARQLIRGARSNLH